MDKESAQEQFKNEYPSGLGTITPTPIVNQVPENKHGIINKVIDLNTNGLVNAPVTFDGSALTQPRTVVLQDQDGYMTLEANLLTNGRVPYATSGGLLTDSSNLTFTGQTLSTVALKVNGDKISGVNSGDQNLFSEIDVAGQSTVTVVSPTTALTFEGGTNVTITTDNSTKKVRFSASGGGSPGGSNTQLQFNKTNTFGGAKIDYSEPDSADVNLKIENQILTDTNGVSLTVNGSDANGDGDGGQMNVIGGDAVNTGYTGGFATLRGGQGGDSGLPASIIAQGGSGHDGGAATIDGGRGTTGNGGDVALTPGAGDGGGNPGVIRLIDGGTGDNAIIDTSLLIGDKTFSLPNQDGIIVVSTSDTIPPASTPVVVGQLYVDTNLKKVYISTGTSSSSDWTILN